MTRQLQDKVAIVTGASNGIGRAIAETFAAEGAKTVLVARRAELLDEVAAGIEAKGGTALPVPADLTSEQQIIALFDRAVKIYGRLDVLVNNAGIATHKNTEDITLEYWNDALAINITAPFLCAREAIKIMKDQTPQGGRIINIGSVSAKTPRAGFAALHDDQVRPAGHDAPAHDGRQEAQHRLLDHSSGRDAELVLDAPGADQGRARRQAGRRLHHGRRGRGQGRGVDGRAAGRGQSVRGDDFAEQHEEFYRPGMTGEGHGTLCRLGYCKPAITRGLSAAQQPT